MRTSYCPGCLKEGQPVYCKKCLQSVFGGRKVSPILPFSRPEYNLKMSQATRISISGVQTKHTLKLVDDSLELTEEGGTYILKPVPYGPFRNLEEAPANEHFSMQLARQVFALPTADNVMMRFQDGSYAYLTKRFDLLPDGTKLLQEDMAQVAQKTEEKDGKDYKYQYSYEGIAEHLQIHLSTYRVEVENFFKVIVFNYLIHNGDAHLKNFSVLRNNTYGGYNLTPAYDLLNTRIHSPMEPDTALNLFKDDSTTGSYLEQGYYTKDDFHEFGLRIGMAEKRVFRFLNEMIAKEEEIGELLRRSFMSEKIKNVYLGQVRERIQRIKYSHKGSN
ncbi:MAG: HipA domain-containing protein [Bacteroidota bacterium]